MISTFPRDTTMRQAFVRAKVGSNTRTLTEKCLTSLMAGNGLVRERDWNASLSFRTATQLKKQGVL